MLRKKFIISCRNAGNQKFLVDENFGKSISSFFYYNSSQHTNFHFTFNIEGIRRISQFMLQVRYKLGTLKRSITFYITHRKNDSTVSQIIFQLETCTKLPDFLQRRIYQFFQIFEPFIRALLYKNFSFPLPAPNISKLMTKYFGSVIFTFLALFFIFHKSSALYR